MLFYGKIKYIYDSEEGNEDIIITANSYTEAIEKIEKYYGNDLVKQSLELIGPNDFFIADDLKDVKKQIVDNVIW